MTSNTRYPFQDTQEIICMAKITHVPNTRYYVEGLKPGEHKAIQSNYLRLSDE